LRRSLKGVWVLFHEPPVLAGRPGGDFFLHRGQLSPALQIAKIDSEKTARNQAPADQKHRDKEVIADQPPAPPPKNPGSAKILDFGSYPLEHLFHIFCFIAPTNSKERKNGCTLRSLGSSVVTRLFSCLSPHICFHLITFFARASTLGGIVNPSSLAVLRLIASSIFSTVSILRSLG